MDEKIKKIKEPDFIFWCIMAVLIGMLIDRIYLQVVQPTIQKNAVELTRMLNSGCKTVLINKSGTMSCSSKELEVILWGCTIH